MPAIAYAKNLAVQEVKELMGKAYDLAPQGERRELVMALAERMAGIMTLDQIMDWQRHIKQYLERSGNGQAINATPR